MEDGGLDLIHVGGQVDVVNRSSVGALAAHTLERLAIDVAFISSPVWDLDHGVTTPSEAKVAVKQAAMRASRTSLLMASSSKYGAFGMYRIAALEEFVGPGCRGAEAVARGRDRARRGRRGVSAGGLAASRGNPGR